MRRAIILIVFAAIRRRAWVGWRQYLRLEASYKGYAAAEQFVEVPGGSGRRRSGGCWSMPASSAT